MARNKTLYIHYTSPTDVRCCVTASSASQAAKLLATTPTTLKLRGKVYSNAEQVPEELHPAMALAVEHPERVIAFRDGTWKPLSGDPANVLLSSRQRALRGTSNAQIGSEPMQIRSLTCDDQTWAEFLELGGSKWFRETVKRSYKQREKNASRKA
ncbi:hypothetical protein [Stutzerimonas stutzeri]|uniref:hypothetical protein n=1 Tax=Stutzerimonas stutzeri TaxID=316 RepID=UPI00265D2BFE|nr:hypothetical protein [Stutzerimonas stutzeri]MCF6783364.1 hypothetical protein [Stutzerimonas stutzeri]